MILQYPGQRIFTIPGPGWGVELLHHWVSGGPGQLILQPDAATGIDTSLFLATPAVNYGTAINLSVRGNAGQLRNALVRFDLSSIVGVSSITAATLTLYEFGLEGGSVSVHRCLVTNWTELGATWNTKDGVNPWPGSAGAETAGTDYVALAEDTKAMSGGPAGTPHVFNVLTAVQAVYASGSVNFEIRPVAAAWVNLCSSNHATAGWRPKLIVDYIM